MMLNAADRRNNGADRGRSMTFTGAHNGAGFYYGGASLGWLSKERFVDALGCTPFGLLYERGTFVPSVTVVDKKGGMYDPYPGRCTLLGFIEFDGYVGVLGADYVGIAVYANPERRGAMVDATAGSPNVERRSDAYAIMAHDLIVNPQPGPLTGTLSVSEMSVWCCGIPRVLAPSLDAGLLPSTAATFVGSWNGVSSYYGGDSHGWVTATKFKSVYHCTPMDFCRNKYRPFVSGTKVTSKLWFPNHHPDRACFLGFLRWNGVLCSAVFANSRDVEPSNRNVAGYPFDVIDLTQGSPNVGGREGDASAVVGCARHHPRSLNDGQSPDIFYASFLPLTIGPDGNLSFRGPRS